MNHLNSKRLGLACVAVLFSVFLFSSSSTAAWTAAWTAAGSSAGSSASGGEPESGNAGMARNRFIGAKACKNCHSSKSKGEQYTKWEQRNHGHAQAFAVLGTAEAKRAGAKSGVADPQKNGKCLQCHVTAYGEKKKMVKRSFKAQLGVQCESCHGPGEIHAKARFKAASSGKADPSKYVEISNDEIIRRPSPKTCLKCHNKKSPEFKPFCFKEKRALISHHDPRKKRTAKELEALKCKCGKDCKCTQAECGGYEAVPVKKPGRNPAPKK